MDIVIEEDLIWVEQESGRMTSMTQDGQVYSRFRTSKEGSFLSVVGDEEGETRWVLTRNGVEEYSVGGLKKRVCGGELGSDRRSRSVPFFVDPKSGRAYYTRDHGRQLVETDVETGSVVQSQTFPSAVTNLSVGGSSAQYVVGVSSSLSYVDFRSGARSLFSVPAYRHCINDVRFNGSNDVAVCGSDSYSTIDPMVYIADLRTLRHRDSIAITSGPVSLHFKTPTSLLITSKFNVYSQYSLKNSSITHFPLQLQHVPVVSPFASPNVPILFDYCTLKYSYLSKHFLYFWNNLDFLHIYSTPYHPPNPRSKTISHNSLQKYRNYYFDLSYCNSWINYDNFDPDNFLLSHDPDNFLLSHEKSKKEKPKKSKPKKPKMGNKKKLIIRKEYLKNSMKNKGVIGKWNEDGIFGIQPLPRFGHVASMIQLIWRIPSLVLKIQCHSCENSYCISCFLNNFFQNIDELERQHSCSDKERQHVDKERKRKNLNLVDLYTLLKKKKKLAIFLEIKQFSSINLHLLFLLNFSSMFFSILHSELFFLSDEKCDFISDNEEEKKFYNITNNNEKKKNNLFIILKCRKCGKLVHVEKNRSLILIYPCKDETDWENILQQNMNRISNTELATYIPEKCHFCNLKSEWWEVKSVKSNLFNRDYIMFSLMGDLENDWKPLFMKHSRQEHISNNINPFVKETITLSNIPFKLSSINSLILTSPYYHVINNSNTINNYYLINDNALSLIPFHDFYYFNLSWKVPHLFLYTKTLINPLKNPNQSLTKSFNTLSLVKEWPKEGELIGIDAEFVILQNEEIVEIGGKEEELKNNILFLARLSLLKLKKQFDVKTLLKDDMEISELTDNVQEMLELQEICKEHMEVVEFESFSDLVLRRDEPVIDYLTRYSGIYPGDLDDVLSPYGALVDRKQVDALVRELIRRRVRFVGHALENDFRILNIVVPDELVIDTVLLFRLPHRRRISLRFLSLVLLNLHIQTLTHSSIEDAHASLLLYRLYLSLKSSNLLSHILTRLYRLGDNINWDINHLV